jgi:hypothetical protein
MSQDVRRTEYRHRRQPRQIRNPSRAEQTERQPRIRRQRDPGEPNILVAISPYACAQTGACGNVGPVSPGQALAETALVGGVVIGGLFAPEIGGAGAAIGTGVRSVGQQGFRTLFGKGGVLNRGPNFRVGIGREGGRSTFRVAGKLLEKIPSNVRERLGIQEIREGVYKWDLWDRGPL